MILFSRLYLYLLTAVTIGPIAFLLGRSLLKSSLTDKETWSFIFQNMLWDLTLNTLVLGAFTVLMSLLTGLLQAVLICFTNIGAKKTLHTLFVLPLAFPLYILAFIYAGSLEYSGPIPSYFRKALDINLTQFIPIKSPFMIALVFSFAFTPYAYLFLKSAFTHINKDILWTARSLGKSPSAVLIQLILPQARYWIGAASIFIFLEVLCDFGGVSVFNYNTFSTAIYHSWISLFSLNAAVKLSVLPLLFVFMLYFLNFKFCPDFSHHAKKTGQPTVLFEISSWKKNLIKVILLIYFFFAFLFPLGQLAFWIGGEVSLTVMRECLKIVLHTLLIAIGATVLIGTLSLLMAFIYRYALSPKEKFLSLFTKMGYAIPGSIVAIGVMSLYALWKIHFFGALALGALFVAYLIRFFPIAFEMQNRGYASISQKLDWVSHSLGKTPFITFLKIHLPLLTPTLISSLVILLIEMIKEMPMTLILRPYGINTLATKVYELTSEGDWERASVFGGVFILLGFLSVFLSEHVFNRTYSTKDTHSTKDTGTTRTAQHAHSKHHTST